MARLTRREMKQDELQVAFEEYERFAKEHWKEIVAILGMAVAVVGLAVGLKFYADRQGAEANSQLGLALQTFHAYVGAAAPGVLGPDARTFPTAREKYKKALEQFTEVTRKYPRTKAAAIARYHEGVCQAQVGDEAGAIKTLQEASRYSDRAVASLAQLALAGELAKTGKLPEAAKLYQDLADHPTSAVPRATAMLALAGAYRLSQPAQARQLYERLEKEYGSDAMLSQVLKQQMASLTK